MSRGQERGVKPKAVVISEIAQKKKADGVVIQQRKRRKVEGGVHIGVVDDVSRLPYTGERGE